MRLAVLALVATLAGVGPGWAIDSGISVKVNSFNRNNAAHSPTVIFTLENNGQRDYSAIYIECTALNDGEEPLEVLQDIASNVAAHSAVHQQGWFLTNIPTATHASCRVGMAM